MKTNGGNGKKAKAAVTAAVVKTMDGVEIAVDVALTLSREALLGYKRAAGEHSPIAKMLSGIIATLEAKGPDAFAFGSTSDPKATALVSALATVRLKGELKLFVPLTEERAKRDAYLASKGEKEGVAKKTAEEQAAKARAKIEESAKAKAAARAKRQAEEQAAATALAGFVDQTVVDGRRSQQAEREEQFLLRQARIKPFALGQAVVVLDGGRPVVLRATLEDGSTYEVPIAVFAGIQAFGERVQKGIDPANIPITCSFCERDMHLGDMLPPRQGKDEKPMPAVQQVSFEARTPDGEGVWSYTRGPRQGQPRPQNVVACKGCASIARGMGPKVEIDNREKPGEKKLVPAIRSYDLYRSYKEWTEGQTNHAVPGQFDANGDAVMARGEAPTLKTRAFSAEDMAAAAAALKTE